MQLLADAHFLLTGLEMQFDAASVRQTNEYVIGLSEMKRREQKAEMKDVYWQLLFDESGRAWGKVCLKGEAALRNDQCQPSMRIISVDIGAKLDADGVCELALQDLTREELSHLLSWLTDNCSTMSGESGGACTRAAVRLILDGIRQTMLPRPPCILHAIALPYVNGHKGLVGKAPPFKRGYAKVNQLDSYLKNLEYFGDKDWDTTRLIMIGLGYVCLPKWDKDVQIVHNTLALDHPARQLNKETQKQIAELPCAREKMRKAKTNRWLFNHMACKSAEKHDFVDLMYCLQQTTQIDYRDPDRPRIWQSEHKDTMEGRHVKWRCGASLNVVMTQCHLKAEVDFGNNLINPMHCRSIRGGDTPIVPFVKPVGRGPGQSAQYQCAPEHISVGNPSVSATHQQPINVGTSQRHPTQVLEKLTFGYRMPDLSFDAEDWLQQLLVFKVDPFRSATSVFHRSHTFAQQVLFPRARHLAANPHDPEDPLHSFERDLQNCADASFKSGEEWFRPLTRFPYLAGVFSNAEHGPALARAVLIEKCGASTFIATLGEFPVSGVEYKPHSPAYNNNLFQRRRIPHSSQCDLLSKYRLRITDSIADEARRQETAFQQRWATPEIKSVRLQVAADRAAIVHANKLFDSFQFLDLVLSSPLMKTDFILFSMANTPVGIQKGISPYLHHYPRLHCIFRRTVAAQLVHQQKIENDFGKVDNISQRSSKRRMKALMLWRENVQRTAFNNESVQQLGTRERRGMKKRKRNDCNFALVEYKSKVVKSECLAATKEVKRKAVEMETAACVKLTEKSFKRKELKAKKKASRKPLSQAQSQAKLTEQSLRKEAFEKCCKGCECGNNPCDGAGLVRCGQCDEIKKRTCMKKVCKQERAMDGATLDVRLPAKKQVATTVPSAAKKGSAVPSAANNHDSSSDESDSSGSESDGMFDCESCHGFNVGDTVKVYWSMKDPAEWFPGEVVKCGSRGIKVFYPGESEWQWHDPHKWGVEYM